MEFRITSQRRLPLWKSVWQSAVLVVAWLAASAFVLPFLVMLAEFQSTDVYNTVLVVTIVSYGLATLCFARRLHREGLKPGAMVMYALTALYVIGQIAHLVRALS